jgi:hypothetical protein
MIAFCANCGNKIAENSKFCVNCGSAVQGEATQRNDVPQVMAEKKDYSHYCTKCHLNRAVEGSELCENCGNTPRKITTQEYDVPQGELSGKVFSKIFVYLIWFCLIIELFDLKNLIRTGKVKHSDEFDLFHLGLLGIYLIMHFIWIYITSDNCRKLGAKNMSFTPLSAVGWFFVPIANLVMPYFIMKELYQASYQASENPNGDWKHWKQNPVSIIIPIWYVFNLLPIIFLYTAIVCGVFDINEFDKIFNAKPFNYIFSFVFIIGYVSFTHIIRNIRESLWGS